MKWQLADQIDPRNGTNLNLPHNVQRKLFDYGIQSRSHSARSFCNQGLSSRKAFSPHRPSETAQMLALDALQRIRCDGSGRKKDSRNLEKGRDRGGAETDQSGSPDPVVLPAISERRHPPARTFAPERRTTSVKPHAVEFARLFSPSREPTGDKLNEVIQSKYGKDDVFSKLTAGKQRPNLKMILPPTRCP